VAAGIARRGKRAFDNRPRENGLSEWFEESWEDWLGSRDDVDRERAIALLAKFREAGCAEPESWVRSEIEEDFAQLARFLLLRALWKQVIQPWQEAPPFDDFPAALRLIEAGADREDVRLLCGSVALDTLSRALYQINFGEDVDVDPVSEGDLPGWRLMERAPGSDRELTGRGVGFLHESLLSVDPTGAEGREFWTTA
jgi:hypothetical protein